MQKQIPVWFSFDEEGVKIRIVKTPGKELFETLETKWFLH